MIRRRPVVLFVSRCALIYFSDLRRFRTRHFEWLHGLAGLGRRYYPLRDFGKESDGFSPILKDSTPFLPVAGRSSAYVRGFSISSLFELITG